MDPQTSTSGASRPPPTHSCHFPYALILLPHPSAYIYKDAPRSTSTAAVEEIQVVEQKVAAVEEEEQMCMGSKQRHFILVHGAGHGPWCWYKVATMLRSAGDRVTTPDLAGGPLEELRSIRDQMRPLTETMDALPPGERAILVAHSMGSVAASLAVEAFPDKISAAVFVTGTVTWPGAPFTETFIELFGQTSPEDLLDCSFSFDRGPENLPTTITYGPEFISCRLYQCCPPEDLTLAYTLVRPEKYFFEELSSGALLSEERYGSVARVYVVCEEDGALKRPFQRWAAERCRASEVVEIAGADHMVMFSKPRKLCDCLLQVAEKHPY